MCLDFIVISYLLYFVNNNIEIINTVTTIKLNTHI